MATDPLSLAFAVAEVLDQLAIPYAVIHRESARKIDIFVAGRDAFSESQMTRRVRVGALEGGGPQFWVASPEDVVLQKLRWYAKGGGMSDRQWRDVLGVLKVQGARLDRAYLTTWDERLGVSDFLHQALRQSGLVAEGGVTPEE